MLRLVFNRPEKKNAIAAAMRLTKRLMKGAREAVLKRIKVEGAHFAAQLKSAEFREAGMAFMQKRKPDFSKIS